MPKTSVNGNSRESQPHPSSDLVSTSCPTIVACLSLLDWRLKRSKKKLQVMCHDQCLRVHFLMINVASQVCRFPSWCRLRLLDEIPWRMDFLVPVGPEILMQATSMCQLSPTKISPNQTKDDCMLAIFAPLHNQPLVYQKWPNVPTRPLLT